MTEADIMRDIQLRASKIGIRLFRNNTGMGWAGQAIKIEKISNVQVYPGDIIIKRGRPFHSGLCEGSPDLIGWVPLKIGTLDIAVFTAVEVKSDTGRITHLQNNFIQTVNKSGGLSCISRSADEFEGWINQCKNLILSH